MKKIEMKIKNLNWFLLSTVLLLHLAADAQQRRTNTRRNTGQQTQQSQQSGYGTQSSGYGTPSNTQQQAQQSAYGNNNQQQPSNQPPANIPVVLVPSKGTAFDSVRPSQRADALFERNLNKERKPLIFEHIREDDAVYRQRVWREIDTREKMNMAFRYSADEDNGNQRFISILIAAIRDRKITAFDPVDDRFTTPITPEKVMEAFSGGLDTVPVYDLQGNITRYEARPKEFDPDSIYRYRIKEEWVFDKESSRMFVRILGIAPIKPIYTSTGIFLDMSPLFWVYYPDDPVTGESLRQELAKFEIYNAKNYGARMTWEEYFENRMFSSYITKSTIDNPYDRTISSFIKDPFLRLLEGDNIKEKIFNYEQDLWSF